MKLVNKIAGLLKIEIASVRANLLPMVILWGLAGAAVAAYYLLPGVAGALKVFADWQVEYGKVASFVNRFVCGGLVPGVFLLTMPLIRPKKAVATVLVQAVWNGLMGMMTDVFFTWQGVWFGTEPSLTTVILKTLVDQFGFCVLFITPLNALFYAWVGNGFSFRREGRGMTRDWFVRSYVSNIVMSWAISIPMLMAVYAFPMELQITISGFIGACQALLFIFIGRKA
ncbi:MAG: hypothetical protein KBT68_03540 [bacterium]|nr:hypothetical protein [Candidatus Colisoma equi]